VVGEFMIKYVKPVWKGKLLALGKVVKNGKTNGRVECDVRDENDQLIARATGPTWQSPSNRR
jgi:uncharacterized protein (TIGR00369 family)